MPWTRDRDTGELVGFSGPKMTADDYDREADLIVENWMRGYAGGEPQDVFGWAAIARKRARELREIEAGDGVNVWIVTQGDYDGDHIHGVFASEQAANKFRDKLKAEEREALHPQGVPSYWSVHEHEVVSSE